MGQAQSSVISDLNPLGATRNGIHLYSLSAFAGYSTNPFLSKTAFLPTGVEFQPNWNLGGGATLGWTHLGAKTDFSLNYVGIYSGNFPYSDVNAMNQSLSFGVSRSLGHRWILHFAGHAGDMTTDQMLFTPTVFSAALSIPTNFDELANAFVAGKFTNDKLASLLTGAPVLESPAGTLLFGNRLFTTSASTSLSYSASPRLMVYVGGVTAGGRHLDTNGEAPASRGNYIVPRTSALNSGLGLTYALTPRTYAAFDLSGSRTFSSYLDAYTTSATVSLSRIFNRRWFATVQAGTGITRPVRETYRVRKGPRFLGGATVGYKTYAHAFIGSYDRSISDVFGLVGSSVAAASGAWRWQRPGSRWMLMSSVGHQLLQTGDLFHINGWMLSTGLSRALGRGLYVQTQYAYLTNSGHVSGSPRELSRNSVRISLAWQPRPEVFR